VNQPRAWTFSVLRHEIGRQLRHDQRETELTPEMETQHEAVVYGVADSDAELTGLLSVLTSREEEVVILRLSSLKYREIVKRLGIGSNAVNTLLARALRKVSTLRDLGCFSFQKFKNLPGGEAGAVITNSDSLFHKAYGFHSHYRTPDEGPMDAAACRNGVNLRMSEFPAAVLMTQLTRLEAQPKSREQSTAYLTSLLRAIPGIAPAKMYSGCTPPRITCI
jgi:DNA-binding CsgD family transcriptional regulator